ncbi:hypothetical protein ACQKKK_10260 [Peribacillus sp. NPDC006672]|uniref:hypothetical protein n=1 Tax=Peribacillus sp. NPDC006672 TaxID=3390606 RepID=UPI003CFF1513
MTTGLKYVALMNRVVIYGGTHGGIRTTGMYPDQHKCYFLLEYEGTRTVFSVIL